MLEVGCSSGYLSRELRNLGYSVTGVEKDATAAARAEEGCERVVIGDIESEELWSQLDEDYDVIIAADVVEHLFNPAQFLRQAKQHIRNNGKIIVSFPNIAHLSVRRKLLFGRFTYRELGIFDRSHLRFFTMREGIALLRARGVEVLAPGATVLEELDPERFEPGVVIHPGCTVRGRGSSFGAGTHLGRAGGGWFENVCTGRGVDLYGGYFKDAVFLDGVVVRGHAEMRGGTVLEEEAEAF